MSRSWSHYGFNAWVYRLLQSQQRIVKQRIQRLRDDGTIEDFPWFEVTEPTYKVEHLGDEDVWYSEGPSLERYIFPDGRRLVSYIQECPWASGPCTFMALKDEASGEPVAESLWTQQEILDRI